MSSDELVGIKTISEELDDAITELADARDQHSALELRQLCTLPAVIRSYEAAIAERELESDDEDNIPKIHINNPRSTSNIAGLEKNKRLGD